jgi:lycopene beta-cyclase
MQVDLDVLIIGAGCAGLSLGVQLAKINHRAPKTMLLEQRALYENDRTWCFWGQQENAYSDLVDHQWANLLVKSAKETISLECSSAPYKILSSKTFYDDAIQRIGLNPSIELRMNSKLLKEPRFNEGWWSFETSFGNIRSKTVVDTRPIPFNHLQDTKLWQSFVGYEIESNQSVFDPNTAVLMDFCKANSEFIGFNYVLPQSQKRALIEFTVFAKRPYQHDELVHRLDEAVAQYLRKNSFTILRKETGLIPMGLADDQIQHGVKESNPTYVHAGLTAGAARPATGYAFQRIQSWAVQCAKSLAKLHLPITHSKSPVLLRKMDDIFLNVIRNHPELGPDLFMDLFGKVDNKRMVRFLSDRGRLLDCFAIVRALPAAPFLKNIFSFTKN